jgi:hypothetical protein
MLTIEAQGINGQTRLILSPINDRMSSDDSN